MMLTELEVALRVQKYEAVVRTTASYWKATIPREYAEEDIQQELRITVVKALRKWNPDHPNAMPERDHVFGAMRNSIKDLQRKGQRQRVEEELTERMPGEDLPDGWSEGSGTIGLPKNGNGVSHMEEREEFLNGLPETHQRMSMMIITGYSKREIKAELSLTDNDYREHMSSIKAHVRGLTVTYAACEVRTMTAWEQLVLTDGVRVA